MCVLSECDIGAAVANQPGEAGADCVRLERGPLPFVVDELRSLEPCALLRLEADVGPRLVRVTGQQQAFGDAKS